MLLDIAINNILSKERFRLIAAEVHLRKVIPLKSITLARVFFLFDKCLSIFNKGVDLLVVSDERLR